MTNDTMTGEELGQKLLQSIREMKAGQAARITQPNLNTATTARLQTGLSQTEFAKILHISSRTLQDWEQGRRNPSRAAEMLLKIVAKHPEMLNELAM